MKQERITTRYGFKVITEFNSLNEFYDYSTKTEFNNVFRYSGDRQSTTGTKSFTQTSSFEEAVELFKNGWESKAKELEQKLKVANQTMKPYTKQRAQYDMVGFQASVPRYLQGIPTSMINKKNVVQKQKVITLNKSVNYSSSYSTNEIMENSIRALQIIQKIEAQGVRCNLNIILGFKSSSSVDSSSEIHVLKIRVKSANERLNISKIAFPLVHPSMLRRLMLRFLEVSPFVKDRSFIHGYGYPVKDDEKQALNYKDEHFLPREISSDIEKEVENILK